MKIGIIGAMEEEVQILRDQLVDASLHETHNHTFITGPFQHHEIILLQCGVGKANAAIGTTLLNQLFQPQLIINIGSAGTVHDILKPGDIVIGKTIRYHDVDVTDFGFEPGQMYGMPAFYQSDTKLIELARSCKEQLSPNVITTGTIVSGDSFINDPRRFANIRQEYNAIEMESCAIAQACHIFKVPFIVLRAISDHVGADSNKEMFEAHLHLASKNSTRLALALLEKL